MPTSASALSCADRARRRRAASATDSRLEIDASRPARPSARVAVPRRAGGRRVGPHERRRGRHPRHGAARSWRPPSRRARRRDRRHRGRRQPSGGARRSASPARRRAVPAGERRRGGAASPDLACAGDDAGGPGFEHAAPGAAGAGPAGEPALLDALERHARQARHRQGRGLQHPRLNVLRSSARGRQGHRARRRAARTTSRPGGGRRDVAREARGREAPAFADKLKSAGVADARGDRAAGPARPQRTAARAAASAHRRPRGRSQGRQDHAEGGASTGSSIASSIKQLGANAPAAVREQRARRPRDRRGRRPAAGREDQDARA